MDKTEIVVLIRPLILEDERKLVDQEMIEKFKKPEKMLMKEPLAPAEQFKELLFPDGDEKEDKEKNKANIEQYFQEEQR